jgi:phospholipase C
LLPPLRRIGGSTTSGESAIFEAPQRIESPTQENNMSQPPLLPQIKKIVYLMLENRSLDNLLGWLYAGDEQPAVVFPHKSNPKFNGLRPQTFFNLDANSEKIFVQPIGDDVWKNYQGRYQKRSATPISYKVSQCPTKLRTNSFNLKNASPSQACGYRM